MDSQAELFLGGAGDDYYERNKAAFGKQQLDPVQHLLTHVGIEPNSVLEIGCADGWRLARLKEKYGCTVHGIDPSAVAVAAGNGRLANGSNCLLQGTAENLPWVDRAFDVVIFGFCLWLCHPSTWFKIVAESDRVLADQGTLIIHDFVVPRAIHWLKWAPPDASARERQADAWFYDFKDLWLAHPHYLKLAEHIQVRTIGKLELLEVTVVLRKLEEGRFVPMTRPVEEGGEDRRIAS